jgi:superfamily II DNA or RNA helicase
MARMPVLTYDRGTLILHPPPRGKGWMEYATWDDRVEKFRIPGINYRDVIEALQQDNTEFIDKAKAFVSIELNSQLSLEPYPHQAAALLAWKQAGRQGVVVLPTGAGKTLVAQLAIASTPRSTLILVPTIDLMHQWYAQLLVSFPGTEIGLLGGGSRDRTPILISTYDSAAIQIESLGHLYGLLICDECHHLPTDFYRVVAEYSIAPYRLGLSATPERSDGKHEDLAILIGKEVYRQTAADLAGSALAPYRVEQIKVKLSEAELSRYHQLIAERDAFLRSQKIFFGSIDGWQKFIRASCRSAEGRRAMLAHREAKEITLSTDGKLRVLGEILDRHYPEATLIFTSDNATVYRIAQSLLIPAITHHTPVKERHEILTHFRAGTYNVVVASQVLNEGVDVPAASIAVILSGTASPREYIQRLGRILRKGKTDKQAVLYEVISEGTSEERVSARRRGETVDINKQKSAPGKVVQLPIRYNEPVEPARKVAEPKPDPKPTDPDGKLKY